MEIEGNSCWHLRGEAMFELVGYEVGNVIEIRVDLGKYGRQCWQALWRRREYGRGRGYTCGGEPRHLSIYGRMLNAVKLHLEISVSTKGNRQPPVCRTTRDSCFFTIVLPRLLGTGYLHLRDA